MSKGGRPSKYKETFCIQVKKLCMLGATDKEIAEFFEVSVDTINEWKKVHPEFSASIEDRESLIQLRNLRQEAERAKRREYRKSPHIRVSQNIYQKNKLKSNPQARLKNSFSSLIRGRLKSKTKSGTFKHLNYTIIDLMSHLQSQFVDGMTWENYGSIWHIDHKKPDCLFFYSTMEDQDFIDCWALANLQPLFSADNLKKGAKYACA